MNQLLDAYQPSVVWSEVKLPSKKKVQYRKYTAKEEKDFWTEIQKVRKDPHKLTYNIMTFLRNTIHPENAELYPTLSLTDILYLWLINKKESKTNIIPFSFRCKHCGTHQPNGGEVNLDKDISVSGDGIHDIKFNEDIILVMRELPCKDDLTLREKYKDNKIQYTYSFFFDSIDTILIKDQPVKNISLEDKETFLGKFSATEMQNALHEFKSMVRILEIKQECHCLSCDKKDTYTMKDDISFFVSQ